MSLQQISLYYKDGSSDKVYHAQIEAKDAGFVVNFQYGRRGGNLAAGTKTTSPVDMTKAQSVLASLIKEKTAKGYTEGESGAVFQSKTFEDRVTGIVPQLLNKISEEDLEKYFRDDSFLMQEKKDGKRIIVKSEKKVITAINKKGLETLIPQVVCDAILSLGKDCIVDGELIAEKYHIFDLLSLDGKNFKDTPYSIRYKELQKMGSNVVPAYFNYKDKKAAFEDLKVNKKEGVVFKKDSSLYVAGRPASGGNQLKFKFYETGTFEVYAHHKSKNSVSVCAYDAKGKQVKLGNITIYSNFRIPPIGSFVEIKYMHCFTDGALYQTTYLGERDDQDKTDCTVAQIKFKPKDDEDED